MPDLKRQFEMIISAKDKASTTFKKVGDAIAEAKNKANKSKFNISEELSKVQGSAGGALTTINELRGMFIAAAGAATGYLVKSFIDSNRELSHLAKTVGMTTENLSAYSNIAKMSGLDTNDFTEALNEINIKLVETPELLQGFGIATSRAGKIINSEDAFLQMADKIAAIKDPAKAAQIAMSLMGDEGQKLIPILKRGSAGILKLKEDVKAFGAETSTELGNASEVFGYNVQKTEMFAKGLGNSIMSKTLPYLNLLGDALLDMGKNSELTKTDNELLAKSFSDLAKSQGFIDLIATVGVVGDAIQGVFRTANEYGSYAIDGFKRIFASVVFLKDTITAYLNNDGESYRAAKTAYDDIQKQIQASAEKTYQESLKPYTKFSDGLNSSLKKVVEASDAAVAANKANLDKNKSISTETAKATISAVAKQIAAVSSVSDAAKSKAQDAIAAQKNVVVEFEALQKRLKQRNPGGNLGLKLEDVKRNADATQKINEAYLKQEKEAYADTQAAKLAKLQQEYDEKRKLADESKTIMDDSIANDAKKALLAEQQRQKQAAFDAELNEINKTRFRQEANFDERMNTRSAVYSEIASIQQNIAQNTKNGITNELEIERLREVGKVLEENKNKATGIFGQFDFEQYSQQLRDLSKQAADDDAKILQEKADAALKTQLEVFNKLQADMAALRLGVDEPALQDTIKNLSTQLEDGLSNIKATITTNLTTQVGSVDPAALKPRDINVSSLSDRALALPNNTLAVESATTSVDRQVSEKNVTIDLRTNNGTIKLDSNTSQEEIDARARAALRRS